MPAAGSPGPRPRPRRRPAGSSPRPPSCGTTGPRCGPGARAWRPGTWCHRGGRRRRALRGAGGEPSQRVGDVELHGRAEVDAAGQDDLVDAATADGAENWPTSRSQASRSGCSAAIVSGAKTGRATMPFGLGSSSPARRSSAAHRRSIVAVASTPRAADRGPGQRGATRRAGVHELRQDQRCRPERRPDVVAPGRRPVNPRPPTRTGLAPSTWPPRRRSRHARSASAKRSGPRARSPRRGRCRPARVPSAGRSHSAASRPASAAAANSETGSTAATGAVAAASRVAAVPFAPAMAAPRRAPSARRGDLHASRTRPDGRHRAFSGNAAPSAMAASGTSAMRASPTPTDRRRIARSGG